jgi:serine protease
MRIAWSAAAALALLFSLAVTGTASAATCSHPASAYSTGAPWDVENPGPQPVSDPVFPDQWGLGQIGAPAAWQRGERGTGATIAVVDSGVDLVHPDLQSKLVPGADMTPEADQGCPGPQDENGHGTHVAGIAAAATDNGIGVAGTAPDARIMPVRVLNADGSGGDAEVIAGIKYAADNGADVINMSLGGLPIVGELPQANAEIAAAVEYAYSKGSLVVAAAGNESLPLCSYPAAAQHAICVAATDSRGLPTFYSNFPASPEDNVRVRAPGGVGSIFCEDSEDIWSTVWPEGDGCADGANDELSGYETFSGTSMASPFVAGVAALLASRGLTNAQILECIKTTSSNQGAYDPVMGYGIVDADAATAGCSAGSTASFTPSGSGLGGGGSSSGPGPDYLTVTVKRTSRRRLARKRRVLVTIESSKPVTVRLRAITRRARRKAHTAGRRQVALGEAGRRSAKLRISRRAAKRLTRSRKVRFRVRYNADGQKGVAAAR